jgi:post-segregation antitoxin (ccd killing protein)
MISLQLTISFKKEIEERAKELGLNVSNYIRYAVKREMAK